MRAAAVCLKEAERGTEVLLVKRAGYPLWEFPGGELGAGEMPFEAAVRALLQQTGYAGRVKRAPVAHRDSGEVAFVLVRSPGALGQGEPRRRPGWFRLEAAAAALQRNRTPAEALPMLTALATAVHWFRLQ